MSISNTSRRRVISALALIPAIPLSGAAVAMDRARSGEDAMNMHSKITEDAHAASQRIDAEFWSARSRWQAIESD